MVRVKELYPGEHIKILPETIAEELPLNVNVPVPSVVVITPLFLPAQKSYTFKIWLVFNNPLVAGLLNIIVPLLKFEELQAIPFVVAQTETVLLSRYASDLAKEKILFNWLTCEANWLLIFDAKNEGKAKIDNIPIILIATNNSISENPCLFL
jgi:hypothetical protein